ncbi:EamA family transporter [Actinoalloteichus hymeniacidonis]|uniref:Permease, DMT superfamily n=1 Tax=Actinoalloteichus hymeniacidonis TaxID=340345 RepID=A0AAC9HRI4_9PSEU|nr:EamA family transporter [Actinoalloteichus hymeniacidonis]AOS63896.1 putative permease, DMT superfamily [Actinoalloteichus hymeniacidonis]MBB5908048.1 drug/metabolite transporter (DMT)-like permease [Actinoalloteichus hymeniacidonis]
MTETHLRNRSTGLLFAVAAALTFGASGPLARALIDTGMDPLHVTWLRVAGAALFLVPVAIRRRHMLRARPGLLLAFGVFPMAGIQAFYFASLARIPVAVALLIEFLGPVLVLVWLRVVRRTPVSRQAAVGIVLAVAGLTLLVEVFSGSTLDPIGIALALGAAACQATFFILSDSGGQDVDPPAVIAFGAIVASVVLLPIAQPWNLRWELVTGTVEISGIAMPAMIALLWLAGVSTALAYLAGVAAVRRLSPAVAGAVGYLEVVTAIVLAWLLIGEALSPMQTLGAVIVLAGAFIAQFSVPGDAVRTDAESVDPLHSGGSTEEQPAPTATTAGAADRTEDQPGFKAR